MDIQTEKLKLIELLLHTNNPSIIEKIKTIFQSEESQDIWEELTDKQKVEIENALSEVKNGQTVPFEELLERHKQ
jgi:predicted Zn-ribbon and HTH transcriptional regulator